MFGAFCPSLLGQPAAAAGITWDLDHAFTGGTLPTNATYARTGSATYTNSSGKIATATANTARFDYTKGASPTAMGLLIEKAATNLFTDSTDFAAAASWNKTRCSPVDNDATSPDNTADATQIADDASTGGNSVHINQTVTVSTSTGYTLSSFAISDNLDFHAHAAVSFTTPANGQVWYNLSTGAVGTQDTGLTGAIEDHGGGWYRCITMFTTDATDTSGSIRLHVCDNDNDINVPLDGTSTIHAWGAQFEACSYATSYIHTSGATATRGASTCIDATVADWDAAGGTLYYEFTVPVNWVAGDAEYYLSHDDGTANEKIEILVNASGSAQLIVTDGGTPTATLTLSAVAAGTTYKVAARIKADDMAAIISGGSVQTDSDTGGSLPTIDTRNYGHDYAGANQCNGWLRAIKFAGSYYADNTELGTLVA